MKHLYRISFVLLAYLGLVFLFKGILKSPGAEIPGEEVVQARTIDSPRIRSADPLYVRLIGNRVASLTDMAQFREHLSRAAQNMLRTRRRAAVQAAKPWNDVIQANWATYQTLLQSAKQDPHGHAFCTICN